ncbi:cation-translocating P-type ATPase [Leeia oryzae]|uniref:cation-translocating P-type ATPase n=1 Tax=Leeia oryzae TaxID=356662 RepID=UPI00035C7ED0|nr:cation-translocating P-type ATPase [Leeia oryzae]
MPRQHASLTTDEANALQAAEGFNELAIDQQRSFYRIALEVIREPMFILLLGAGSIYLLIGDIGEALTLLGFVVIIMLVTTIQERRTERALEALRDISSPRALVIRDGVPVRLPGREVVRGDLMMLSEGDRVAADGRILEAHELALDESMLTGESETVSKQADDPTELGSVFAGTLLTGGQAVVRVEATGQYTQLGKIGQSLQAIDTSSSPLKQEIAALTRRLTVVGLGVCTLLTALFIWIRGDYLAGLLSGITLAMSLLPQEFPVILIVFLAFGARRIATQRVLTRHLSAIETLGATTVLCVDKTGTLTQNRMTVAALIAGDALLDLQDPTQVTELPEAFHELLEYAVLASEMQPHDPMELAFHRLANAYLANTEHLHPDWDLTHEYELSPTLLAMSHLWQSKTMPGNTVASKGAPEAILDLCHLDETRTSHILKQAGQLADQGLRVLGIARARHHGDTMPDIQHDFDFEFLGLIGLIDPLRQEVPSAVAECRSAGIRVIMITGDHPRTAKAIGQQAGLDTTQMLTGADVQTMPAESLAKAIRHVDIFARVSPLQKLQLVNALKANGEVVAMTGDGVNDAPALKAAHIGIAMGKRGTDVAREAAALVLLDDNFGAIVDAIRLGRRIFRNLRQAMVYTFAVHVPIIVLSIFPLLTGLPLILAPIHIAFLELVIDPVCSVVFEAETPTENLMQRPPRKANEPLLALSSMVLSLLLGLACSVQVALWYLYLLKNGTPAETARAAAFVTLISANTGLIFSSRTSKPGVLKAMGGINILALWIIGASLLILLAITRFTSLATLFAFSTLTIAQWLTAFAVGASAIVLFEVSKWSFHHLLPTNR